MAAPAINIDAAHATVISSIPYTVLIGADEVQSSPGTDHALWWVTTISDNQLIAMYAMGSIPGKTYPVGHTFNVPIIQLYTGTPSSLTAYPSGAFAINDTGAIQVGALTRPMTLYIKLTVDGGGFTSEPVDDPLYFRVLPGRDITAETGSFIILSDQNSGTQSWPAQVFGADGQLKQSPTFVSGEQGYMFDDGTYAILNELTSPESLELYQSDGTHITTVTFSDPGNRLNDAVTGDGVSIAFVAHNNGLTAAAVVKSVNKDTGTILDSWTLPANSKSLNSIAVSRDRTVLYYQAAAGTNNDAVHRYDLVGRAALTDLAADDAYDAMQQGIQVLSDGSIAVGKVSNVAGSDLIIRYNTSGAILNTYAGPASLHINMFAPYIDDPVSLLVWAMDGTASEGDPTFSRFYRLVTATGVLTQLGSDVPIFEDGVFAGADSSSAPTFGIPFSCPLLVPRVKLSVPDTPPTTTASAAPLPCCDTMPGSTNPGPVPTPLTPHWIAQCRGGGQVPEAADITDAEDWAA